jgi:hypothetical protein
LDKPFNKGTNHLEIKKYIKEGKNYSRFLNPHDTSIYAWLTFEGSKYMKVRTTERLAAKHWEFSLKRAKKSMAGSAILNERLNSLKSEVLKQYRSLISTSPNASFEEIKVVVKDTIEGKSPNFNKKNFLERFDEYLIDRKTQIKRLTYNKLKSFRNVFTEYLSFINKKPNHFFMESINDQFNSSFRNYLLEGRKLVPYLLLRQKRQKYHVIPPLYCKKTNNANGQTIKPWSSIVRFMQCISYEAERRNFFL